MSFDDAEGAFDLAAVRTVSAARTVATDAALARSWATIAASLPAGGGEEGPGVARRTRWLVPAGAAATVAALAAGATVLLGGGGGEPSEFDPLNVPRITEPSQITFPIDDYFFTTERYVNYHDARVLLVLECLARFGVNVPELEREQLSTDHPDLDRRHERLYGVFNREMAAEWGYRTPPNWDHLRPTDPGEPGYALGILEDELFLYKGRASPEFADLALPEDGDGELLPVDGCDGEAKRILSDGLPDPEFRVRNNDAQARAADDPRVEVADAAWSECMRRAGYEFESYTDPMGSPYDTPEATAAEIAEAVANVDCKVETNLVGVLVAVTSEFEEQFIQERWDELQELKLWLDTVEASSAQVLAAHGY